MTTAPLILSLALAFTGTPVAIRFVPDEAEAAIAILEERATGREPAAADWQRLVASEGYRRLHRREEVMGRGFTDSAFAAFLRLYDKAAARREARTGQRMTRWSPSLLARLP